MATVFVRLAKDKDLKAIMAILDGAKAYLKTQGLTQWQFGYPNHETVQADIKELAGFVLIADSKIVGYAAMIQGEDPSYTAIEDGSWVTNESTIVEYVAIHRFALSAELRGQRLSARFMSALLTIAYQSGTRDIRIDTHPNNLPMQAVVASNGFEKRGIIHITEGTEINGVRWAYQLILSDD